MVRIPVNVDSIRFVIQELVSIIVLCSMVVMERRLFCLRRKQDRRASLVFVMTHVNHTLC